MSADASDEACTAVVPFLAGPLATLHGGSQRSSSEGALVPICSLSARSGASLVCPMCQRPFDDAPRRHAADDADDEEGLAGLGHDGNVQRMFSPRYFRSLPPVQDENDPSSFTTTPTVHGERLQELWGSVGGGTADVEADEEALERQREAELDAQRVREGYYTTHFAEVHRIGGGTFGAVYLCRHVMEQHTLGLFAVKKIPIGEDAEYFCKVLREVRVMEEIKRHPNVLEYHHSWIDYAKTADFGPVVRCLFVLMEYASEGSLEDYLRLHGTSLPNAAVWYFFLSAVAGIAHLHGKGILHRDLKPQNLLLTKGESGSSIPRLLVADFGTAALLSEINIADRTGGTGTIEYMAPELFDMTTSPAENDSIDGDDETGGGDAEGHGGPQTPANALSAHHYCFATSKASDVWSLGMLLHYLACDATLPAVLPDGSVILNVKEHSPYDRPPEMEDLMRAMLHRDPNRRPSCADILNASGVQQLMRSFEREDFVRSEMRPSRRSDAGPSSLHRTSPTPEVPSPLLIAATSFNATGRRGPLLFDESLRRTTSGHQKTSTTGRAFRSSTGRAQAGTTGSGPQGSTEAGTQTSHFTDEDWSTFLAWQATQVRLGV